MEKKSEHECFQKVTVPDLGVSYIPEDFGSDGTMVMELPP
jgi:hypothetical protein